MVGLLSAQNYDIFKIEYNYNGYTNKAMNAKMLEWMKLEARSNVLYPMINVLWYML